MPRIVVAECKQEVSSFNPATSYFDDFRIAQGAALLEHHRRVREELGGALSVFDSDRRFEIVPAFGASAITSGGILTAQGFQRLSEEFLECLAKASKAGMQSVDGAYFSMHGA